MDVHKRPRVVIIGAGFSGLWAAKALAHAPAEVLILDRNNYHTFLPLLYQVAAAELEVEVIAYPIRSILRNIPNASFVMAEVKGMDLSAKVVRGDNLEIPYDFLILATGSVSHFFGVNGAAEWAFPLKTLDHGITLRNHILFCFERAMREPDRSRRQRILTFTIVGGGATGIEFSGALAELIRGRFKEDYPRLNFREVHIVLLEAMEHMLPGLPKSLQNYTVAHLSEMGIDVRLKAMVSLVTKESVYLHDGSIIPTETVIWTAGVRGDPVTQTSWKLPVSRGGRVNVLPTLQVREYHDVYATGDLAYIEENPLPMTAPVAIQQGTASAQNILRQINGQRPLDFHYRDMGTMVTIGRNAAVAYINGRTFRGIIAWLLWLVVHLMKLIGYRNRLFVLINWIRDYFFYERSARLILRLNNALNSKNSGYEE